MPLQLPYKSLIMNTFLATYFRDIILANFQAITKTDFAHKTWRRPTDYIFTAKDSVCPLTAQELPQAMLTMPTGFIVADETYTLVAVQGLQPESNFYLNAAGQWLGKYIPAAYRCYPFLLANKKADKGQLILCIDSDSELVAEDSAGESFFDEAGELSESLAQVLEFLSNVNRSREVAASICKSLQEHNLLKSWDLKIQLETGTQRVDGLYCIDEAALNSLSSEAFIELRQSGALPAAYCQLLSMKHVPELAQVMQSKEKSAASASIDELNMDSMTSDGNIHFDNF
jgi:hypothetical protein